MRTHWIVAGALALCSITAHAEQPTLDQVLEWLQSADKKQRGRALSASRKLPVDSLERIRPVLRHKDAQVRLAAAYAVLNVAYGRIEPQGKKPRVGHDELVKFLPDAERLYAEGVGSPAYVGGRMLLTAIASSSKESLIALLIEGKHEVQVHEATMAAAWMPLSVLDDLTPLLRNESETVRTHAIQAMRSIRRHRESGHYARRLDRSPVDAEQLKKCDDRILVPIMRTLREDPSVPVRVLAAFYCREVGANAEPAVPLLIELTKKDGRLSQQCFLALGEIGPGAAAAIPLIVETARAANWDPRGIPSAPGSRYRFKVERVLYAMGPKGMAALEEPMTHKDVAVRRSTARVFRLYRRREDAAFIAKHFRDPDAQVRKELSRALYRVGPDSPQVVVPFLVKGLADEHEDVRITSAGMLNRIGSPHARPAIPALKKALDDPNEKVKNLARRALKNLTK